ncbi:unnamed protein product [Peniophora sp. CBMAI 1063]|nr:unnamed protein product [Peniophora sp. CBMAI 1063]
MSATMDVSHGPFGSQVQYMPPRAASTPASAAPAPAAPVTSGRGFVFPGTGQVPGGTSVSKDPLQDIFEQLKVLNGNLYTHVTAFSEQRKALQAARAAVDERTKYLRALGISLNCLQGTVETEAKAVKTAFDQGLNGVGVALDEIFAVSVAQHDKLTAVLTAGLPSQ